MRGILYAFLLQIIFISSSFTQQRPSVSIKIVLGEHPDSSEINWGILASKFLTDVLTDQSAFIIIDGKKLSDVSREDISLGQRTGAFLDTSLINQSKSLGIEYLLLLYIQTSVGKIYAKNKFDHLWCKTSYVVQIVNITTSKVVDAENFYGTVGMGFIESHPITSESTIVIEALKEGAKKSNNLDRPRISLQSFIKAAILNTK